MYVHSLSLPPHCVLPTQFGRYCDFSMGRTVIGPVERRYHWPLIGPGDPWTVDQSERQLTQEKDEGSYVVTVIYIIRPKPS